MILAGTGHRPEGCESEDVVREKIRHALVDSGAATVITGMAAGFDLYLGLEALSLGIEVWAARPWAGHAPRASDFIPYGDIVTRASRVIAVDPSMNYPGPWVYQKRNEWMVDNATHLLAYWNGTTRGGTYNCLTYAMKKQVPYRNIYDVR